MWVIALAISVYKLSAKWHFGTAGTGESIPQDLSISQGCVWYTVVSPTVLCSWESESREKCLVFVSLQLYMQEVV